MPNNIDNRQETDEEIHQRRMRRIEEMKRQKKEAEERQRKLLMLLGVLAVVAVLLILIIVIATALGKKSDKVKEPATPSETVQESIAVAATPAPTPEATPEPKPVYRPLSPAVTAQTAGFSGEISSTYGIVVDVTNETILAQKDYKVQMSPASMTKILTVLTAAKALEITGEDWQQSSIWNDKFTMTLAITDYSFVNDCSNVGFEVGEEIPIIDLFYGTIMPSGADAAVGLATYVAGSHEAFVDMMNEELVELGLSGTSHFTNCVGLYDKDLYSTVYDIAVIMKAAMDIPFLREVMGARVYTTTPTERHADGMVISNLFLRRIEDRDTHSTVIGAKTGYVVQSKSCSASMAITEDGREYICVTAGAADKWKCIYDHTGLYQTYIK